MDSLEALRLTKKDNVAVSLGEVERGAEVRVRIGKEANYIKVLDKIPFGFKIALTDIAKGFNVIKYGESIGIATQNIKRGQLVHIHNLKGTRGRGDLVKGSSK